MNKNELEKMIGVLEELLEEFENELENPNLKMSTFTDEKGNLIPAYDLDIDIYDKLVKEADPSDIYASMLNEFNIVETLIEFKDSIGLEYLLDDIIFAVNPRYVIREIFTALWEVFPPKRSLCLLHRIIEDNDLDPRDYV